MQIITGKPLEKLITIIGDGIGCIFEPWQIKRKANADAYRIEKIADAKAKGMIITAEAEMTIAQRAQNRVVVQEIDRQINIEDIASKAVKYLKEAEVTGDVDRDWKTRFFSRAQEVSNEDMQEIWANILAQEIHQPGKTSLRTLEVLSNISPREGKIFEKFCSLAFDHAGIYHPPGCEIYTKFGLTVSDLMLLRSARLIHSTDNLLSRLPLNRNANGCFISRNDEIFVLVPGTDKDLTFKIIPLTEEGLELMRMIQTPKDDEYFYAFLDDCKINRKIEYRKATPEDIQYLSEDQNCRE